MAPGLSPKPVRRPLVSQLSLAVALALLALLCLGPLRPESAQMAAARAQLKKWSDGYNLSSQQPPQQVSVLPRAPHLEECSALAAMRAREEEHAAAPAPQGQQEEQLYPDWACATVRHSQKPGQRPNVTFCSHPRPPWVQGTDDDNLPLTRVAQRDLWVRQFPPGDCSQPGLRFLVVDWFDVGNHGIGSLLHIMSSAFSLAYTTGRILVPFNASFDRAQHHGCRGEGRWGSLDCYFFPLTSPACTARAWALYNATDPKVLDLPAVNVSTLNTSAPVLRVFRWDTPRAASWGVCYEATAAQSWGRPWAGEAAPFTVLGHTVSPYYEDFAKTNWWRSQSIRFMLRWPSVYLCHIMNRVRHEAYGLSVAQSMAAAGAAREAILRRRAKFLDPSEPELLRGGPGAGLGEASGPLEMTPEWRFPAEPFLPRPIVSIHVRQGDKGKEMKLFSLPSFMWLAERLRLMVPNLRNVWLSTEMQSVIYDAAAYKDWNFLYSNIKRQRGGEQMIWYEESVGVERVVGSSFANLIIASQCDYFVGVLGSNWNRLINELRLTNGRKKASYLTLNMEEC